MAVEMRFRDWLQRRARELNQPERLRRRVEWIAALDQLYEQIIGWIRESDPEGILVIERMELERSEPSLGTYAAPALKISLGDAAVRVVPMGRDTHRTFRDDQGCDHRYEGRVDFTDGLRKYILYRAADDGPPQWLVLDELDRPQRFDQRALETILWELLS